MLRHVSYLLAILLLIGCVERDDLYRQSNNPFDPQSSNYGELEYVSQFAISKGSIEPTFIVVSDDGKLYVSWGGSFAGGEGSFIDKYDSDGEVLKELEIKDPYDQPGDIVKIQGLYLADNELYVVGRFYEYTDNGDHIRIQKYSPNLQLISKIGIPHLQVEEEYGGYYGVSAELISVGPNGNYYVTYGQLGPLQPAADLLRLLVMVYDTNGNLATEFRVDTTGIGINGDLHPLLGIAINRADQKYFKLLWIPPLGGVAISYTIKYSSQNTRVKHWEFGWTSGVPEDVLIDMPRFDIIPKYDRLSFTKEGYICIPSSYAGYLGESIGVYNDAEVLHEIHVSDFEFRILGLAFSNTEKRMYALTEKIDASPPEYDVMTFKYYW